MQRGCLVEFRFIAERVCGQEFRLRNRASRARFLRLDQKRPVDSHEQVGERTFIQLVVGAVESYGVV